MQKIAKESSSEVASAIGLIGGMIIYFFIFMYASQVMKGVIEEKTNRIIEVLVSSVKPFQFLLGKIIGVAAVGLVQFLIWVVFGLVLILVMLATNNDTFKSFLRRLKPGQKKKKEVV